MKLWVHFALLMTVVLYTFDAAAHGQVTESTPAANAVVSVAPKEISLAFKNPVRLTGLSIEREDQEKQPLGPLPKDTSTRFSVPAPRLTPGKYAINWTAVGPDGHIGKGTINFTLSSE